MRVSITITLFLYFSFTLQGQQENRTSPASDSQQTVITTGGTAHSIPVFAGTRAIVNSTIFQSGGKVGIGTSSPTSTLDAAGDINLSGSVLVAGNPILVVPGGISASNIALGSAAMQSNSTGTTDTATGAFALRSNTQGFDNTANGANSLSSNTTGGYNTAIGAYALIDNQIGSYNTSVGTGSLQQSLGDGNTAIGTSALQFNTSGTNNIGIGFFAAENVAGSGSNNIHIGNLGSTSDNGAIRIGSAAQVSFFAAGVRGVTPGNNDALAVVIDSNGQLGTLSSSRRYKDEIQDIGGSSDAIMRLRPVSFHYRNQPASREYGLIAEEVAEIYPEAVVFKNGQPDAVQYHKINALLLNEVQRQHDEIERMKQEVSELKAVVSARGSK